MVPFAAANVLDKPLVEALGSSFFSRLNAIEPDEGGVKRCLVGENSHVLRAAVEAGEAFGTTLESASVLAHADAEFSENLPTCFSMANATSPR